MGAIDNLPHSELIFYVALWGLGYFVNTLYFVVHLKILLSGQAPSTLTPFKVFTKAIAGLYCLYGMTIYYLATCGCISPVEMGTDFFRPSIPILIALISVPAITDWIPQRVIDGLKKNRELVAQLIAYLNM